MLSLDDPTDAMPRLIDAIDLLIGHLRSSDPAEPVVQAAQFSMTIAMP